MQGKRDGEVEGVVRGLVDDDEGVLGHAEVVQIDIVLRRGDEVAQLAQLGLPGDFVEELDQVNVGGVAAEVFLEDKVDGRFEHEGVVDRYHTHTWLSVPARLPAASYAGIHDIVAHEEEGLQQFGEPAQRGEMFEFFRRERTAKELGRRVWDRNASVELARGRVCSQVL